MRPTILASLLLVAASCFAESAVVRKLEAKLFLGTRTALQFDKPDRHLLTFCPDETCIEFRSANIGFLEPEALVYLYYFGDYYDLAKWRSDSETKVLLSQLLKEQGLQACSLEAKDIAPCIKKELRHRGLSVANTRYDEGRKTATKVW